MSQPKSVQALLATAALVAECKAKRAAWVRAMSAAWRDAQRAMDDKCMDAVDRLTEAEFDRLCEAEQAKVDRFRVPLFDAAQRDLWPPELYLKGL